MTKKVLITIVVSVGVFAAILLASLVRGPGGGDRLAIEKETEQALSTREDLPENAILVPETDSEGVPKNVARPRQVSSAPGFTLRQFSLRIENGRFLPDTVIVNVGDSVDLSVTAVDGDYDFTQPDFGFRAEIRKGETRNIQFGATVAGQFRFYCASCGGPEKGPTGALMVMHAE